MSQTTTNSPLKIRGDRGVMNETAMDAEQSSRVLEITPFIPLTLREILRED